MESFRHDTEDLKRSRSEDLRYEKAATTSRLMPSIYRHIFCLPLFPRNFWQICHFFRGTYGKDATFHGIYATLLLEVRSFITRYDVKKGYRLSLAGFKDQEWVTNIPLYAMNMLPGLSEEYRIASKQ